MFIIREIDQTMDAKSFELCLVEALGRFLVPLSAGVREVAKDFAKTTPAKPLVFAVCVQMDGCSSIMCFLSFLETFFCDEGDAMQKIMMIELTTSKTTTTIILATLMNLVV